MNPQLIFPYSFRGASGLVQIIKIALQAHNKKIMKKTIFQIIQDKFRVRSGKKQILIAPE